MMQPSAGSQPDQQQQKPEKAFLDNYISQAIKKLTDSRVPDGFQQTVNGQVSQDLTSNKQNYT
jgi:hypothetical protein